MNNKLFVAYITDTCREHSTMTEFMLNRYYAKSTGNYKSTGKHKFSHHEYEFTDPNKYLEFCLKYSEYILNE